MKTPSDLQTTLMRLFDYQKYHPAAVLVAICEEAETEYGALLSDDAVAFLYAAGDSGQNHIRSAAPHTDDRDDSV